MALGLWARPEPVVVTPGDAGLCAALQVVTEPALYDRVAPMGAPPELEAFVIELNIELALVRRQIEEACRG